MFGLGVTVFDPDISLTLSEYCECQDTNIWDVQFAVVQARTYHKIHHQREHTISDSTYGQLVCIS